MIMWNSMVALALILSECQNIENYGSKVIDGQEITEQKVEPQKFKGHSDSFQ